MGLRAGGGGGAGERRGRGSARERRRGAGGAPRAGWLLHRGRQAMRPQGGGAHRAAARPPPPAPHPPAAHGMSPSRCPTPPRRRCRRTTTPASAWCWWSWRGRPGNRRATWTCRLRARSLRRGGEGGPEGARGQGGWRSVCAKRGRWGGRSLRAWGQRELGATMDWATQASLPLLRKLALTAAARVHGLVEATRLARAGPPVGLHDPAQSLSTHCTGGGAGRGEVRARRPRARRRGGMASACCGGASVSPPPPPPTHRSGHGREPTPAPACCWRGRPRTT
jgi:hypothetical protein